MPTISQLVSKGRTPKKAKSRVVALGTMFNTLHMDKKLQLISQERDIIYKNTQ